MYTYIYYKNRNSYLLLLLHFSRTSTNMSSQVHDLKGCGGADHRRIGDGLH